LPQRPCVFRRGTLRSYHRDNPAGASMHEEVSTVAPFISVLNTLVVWDQHAPLNTPATIVPDPAESWSWMLAIPSSASCCARGMPG